MFCISERRRPMLDWMGILTIALVLSAPLVGYVTFRAQRRQTFRRLMRRKGFSEAFIEKAIKDRGF